MVENVLTPFTKIFPVNWHHGRNEGREGGSNSRFPFLSGVGTSHESCELRKQEISNVIPLRYNLIDITCLRKGKFVNNFRKILFGGIRHKLHHFEQ